MKAAGYLGVAVVFLFTLLAGFSAFPTPTALAGVVGVSDTPVLQAATPDTRGGIVLDAKYCWIADHKGGLWRVDRCTGANAGDMSGSDSSAWDLWWYDPYGNYPANPDAGSPAGYFIYEAGANGTLYVFNSSSPAAAVGSVRTGAGVIYGVYATGPDAKRL